MIIDFSKDIEKENDELVKKYFNIPEDEREDIDSFLKKMLHLYFYYF